MFKQRFGSILRNRRRILLNSNRFCSSQTIPESADVVIIGGGSAGTNTLYQLSKRNVKAILLGRGLLTCGTTWHTAGLVWSLKPNDIEIQLLAKTREVLKNLEIESGHYPGWINNGSLFISHSKARTDEFRRMSTIAKSFGIESEILDPKETQKLFPLLDHNAFENALYSPEDGVVDPAQMCTALTKVAKERGCQVVENCPVEEIIVGENILGMKDVQGVRTPYGTIKTNTIVNATGVWGRDLLEPHGIYLPLIPMKHAYVVSETIDGIQGVPNVRDHDYSIYFRIQGQSICMGGYELDPDILGKISKDFQFGLYELDYSSFKNHIEGAVKLCPKFGEAGIKSTICGPESFTPDHKPLMGPDPLVSGLFHNVGFNSAGMMFGGGCANQLAHWIIHDRPELHMYAYDVRRFTPKQRKSIGWATERCHEGYAKNYDLFYPTLAGRNFSTDPFHSTLIQNGAVMEEKAGWERPSYFLIDQEGPSVQPYDWYGCYGHKKNENTAYIDQLAKEFKFDSDVHNLIRGEVSACRENAGLFNLSCFGKLFLSGPQAKEAAEYILTADVTTAINKRVLTCALNNRGGVEFIGTATQISVDDEQLSDPVFKENGFYIVVEGSIAYHTISHINSCLAEKSFDATVSDLTEEMGILLVQGPKSRKMLSKVTDFDLSDEILQLNSTIMIRMGDNQYKVRVMRVDLFGELGYELHIPKNHCVSVYNTIMEVGSSMGLKNAGHQALNALSCEWGSHAWGLDLRSDDTPLEANLSYTCTNSGEYKGQNAIEEQKSKGVHKKLVFVTIAEEKSLGTTNILYRDGQIVGYLRRADFGYELNKSVGKCYVKRLDKHPIDDDYMLSGNYQIEIEGKLYDARVHLKKSVAEIDVNVL